MPRSIVWMRCVRGMHALAFKLIEEIDTPAQVRYHDRTADHQSHRLRASNVE